MSKQSIPCPICQTQITIDIYQLLQGMQFLCSNCHVAIGLSTESKPVVKHAVEELDNLKKGQLRKKE